MLGGLSTVPAVELGAQAIVAAMVKTKVEADQIEHVIMGHVLQGGCGQIPSRQAVIRAGLLVETTTETINKVCASGHRAVTLADMMIRSGQHDVVVAGGMESMSQAPHVLQGLRNGQKMGDASLVDLMIHDGLTDPFNGHHMVVNGAEVAEKLQISREAQDEWALRSHMLATEASEFLAGEIVPVSVRNRKSTVDVNADESVRPDTTIEQLAALKPIMKTDGTTTAGNAPGVNDGAAALVLASEEWAKNAGIEPLASIRGHAYVATDSPWLALTPGRATLALLEKENLSVEDITRFEFNEAFASVAVHSVELSGAPVDRVNVNGGAIAMGHPIGMSGTRIIGTLARELARSGGGLGVAAICSGGGQGDALLIEV